MGFNSELAAVVCIHNLGATGQGRCSVFKTACFATHLVLNPLLLVYLQVSPWHVQEDGWDLFVFPQGVQRQGLYGFPTSAVWLYERVDLRWWLLGSLPH